MRIIREEIKVKGEDEAAGCRAEVLAARSGVLRGHGAHRAFAAKSVDQEPGTAPFKGSLKLAQATSCEDFFDRAMSGRCRRTI